MRCNFDIDDGLISRFGFDANGDDLEQVVGAISKCQKMSLVSLHCHFASRDLASWKNRSLRMTEFFSSLSDEVKSSLKFISLGGGLYGDMNTLLRSQFKSEIPSFTDYAEASAKIFSDCMIKNKFTNITLIIEPGTALAANALKFVTEIQSVKYVSGQTYVTTNGSSFNLGLSKSDINLPFKVSKSENIKNRSKVKNAKVVGYTCIESDVLHSDLSDSISAGDAIIFEEAGSYSVVMKPPFILPNVAIIELMDKFGDFRFIKKKETFDDVFSTYVF